MSLSKVDSQGQQMRPPMTSKPVPKVHPASRQMAPDDPLQLTAVQLPGDPRLMLRLLVEEYARMGWGAEQIMRLARDPFYVALHGLLRAFGEQQLREEIDSVLAGCGVLRVQAVEAGNEPETVELQSLGRDHGPAATEGNEVNANPQNLPGAVSAEGGN